jgi:hypothetical protein
MASPTGKRFIWLGVVSFVCVGAFLLLYAVKLGFSESLYSQRGSFAFFVTITEPVIRSFPAPDTVSEPQYHSGCGDGPKLPDQAISFRSRVPSAQLLTLAEQHIAACGYSSSTARDFPGLAFASGSKTLYLHVAPADDGSTQLNAEVTFNDYQ